MFFSFLVYNIFWSDIMSIYNLTKSEMEEYFISLGSKKFHADQLFSWLYEKRITSISSKVLAHSVPLPAIVSNKI